MSVAYIRAAISYLSLRQIINMKDTYFSSTWGPTAISRC
jgi:hypothetical protein